jgi:hypothetical protein
MAEEKPSLHIDTDWKKQAQEEKKRLAEQEAQRKAAAPAGPIGVVPTTTVPATAAAAPAAGGRAPAQQGGREARRGADALPEATLESLVQSIVTQILYYVGDLAARGGEGMVNLDMAKHNLDVLRVLEEKTQGNLTPEERQMLDMAGYEARMRFINTASRYIDLP